jgi:hypothetical protein
MHTYCLVGVRFALIKITVPATLLSPELRVFFCVVGRFDEMKPRTEARQVKLQR